ncbi:MAG: YdeI/OmpD-associated family protein [Thermoplasmata archaeon]|nr:YdeI/OmpD-associated family protein [Thermoplasmata archaeon]
MPERVRPPARFFARRALLRAWFERNHARRDELWIGYYKKGSGKTGVSYVEAVEEALCFGWVDGQVRSLDNRTYANRYTPRRRGSRWSRINVAKVEELFRLGRMHPSGLRTFEEGTPGPRAGYAFEDRPKKLPAPFRREFQSVGAAWKFFQAQPPYYRRVAIYWIMAAVREDTRRRRLQSLIGESGRGRRIDLLTPGSRK